MPKICRVDRNQQMVVESCERMGATVQRLHTVGEGCPDLLIGYKGKNYLFEVKDPEQTPRGQRLTPAQMDWHAKWRGEVFIVKTTNQAQDILQPF